MRLVISKRFSLKFGLRLMLVVAAVIMVGTTLVRQELYRGVEYRLLAYEQDARLSQVKLQRRLAEIVAEDARSRLALAERLQTLTDQQTVDRQNAFRAPFAAEAIASALVEVICVDNRAGERYYTGSGTVIDESGLVLTNHHLLLSDDGSLIRLCGIGLTDDVTRPPRIQYLGRLAATDPEYDLALLKISERIDGSAPPAKFDSVSFMHPASLAGALRIGDPVYIGGYPGVGAQTLTVTSGVVAGRVGDYLVKTSALIDSGASGGGVFNAGGQYVGVPTAAARGEIGGSLGYLISGEAIAAFLEDFRAGLNLVGGVSIKRDDL
jgi:putative serine protease PepD